MNEDKTRLRQELTADWLFKTKTSNQRSRIVIDYAGVVRNLEPRQAGTDQVFTQQTTGRRCKEIDYMRKQNKNKSRNE